MTAPPASTGKTAVIATVLRGAGLLLGALTTIVIARLLQPERFGDYAFVASLVTLVSVPPTIGLRQVLARETAYATARGNQGHLAALWLWALGWSFLIAVILALVLAGLGAVWPGAPALRTPILAGALVLLVLPAPQLVAGILQGLGRVIASLAPEALVRPGVMMILIAGIWAWSEEGAPPVSAFLLALAATSIVEIIVIGMLFQRYSGVVLSRRRASGADLPRRALALSALSFGAITSLHLINDNLDVLMLGLLADARDTGLYRGATVLSQLVVFGLGIVNFLILPDIAGKHARGDRLGLQSLVTKAARVVSLMAAAGLGILLFAGHPLLSLLFGAEFTEAYAALIILAFGQLANALFGPVALVLNMTGHERLTLIGVLVAVGVNVLLNLLLIPRFGMEGAACASAAALITWNVVLAIILRRRVGYCSSVVRCRQTGA